jgi:hypothetical protein
MFQYLRTMFWLDKNYLSVYQEIYKCYRILTWVKIQRIASTELLSNSCMIWNQEIVD